MTSMLEAALQYAGRQWHVFPVPPNSKKSYKSAAHSDGRNWGATTNPAEITRDFHKWKSAGIGIVMGEKSGVFVVEADTPAGHDKDGIASLAALQKKHGKLPDTLMAASPSGSEHYYFKYPNNGTFIGNSVSKIADGVDVCGEGGMVVAPPTTRKNGAYKWLNNNPVGEAPQWLIDLCSSELPQGGNGDSNPFLNVVTNIAEVEAAMAAIPNDDAEWDEYNSIGMACFAAFGGSDDGFAAFDTWAKKSKKYDGKETEEKWDKYKRSPPKRIGVGTLFYLANKYSPTWRQQFNATQSMQLQDFVAYMPMHNYIYTPTREPWPASSVDARLKSPVKKLPAHTWLDQNNPVEQMTWAPGQPMLIKDRLIDGGGWIEKPLVTCFNLYRPPIVQAGNPDSVKPWLNHIHKIYPTDAKHIINWCAHRVQQPADKINHALVLGGAQGIGKDTILAPLKYAVGPWNFKEITPKAVLERFNEFIKSVVLRINEARDLGDVNRYQFYEHTKVYTAAPPDVLHCDAKHLREHAVLNVCGVIITTNYKTDGIYLPADDRRHYVAWSKYEKEDFDKKYWDRMWNWYAVEGYRNVAAYLMQLDISNFDPKAPPPRTEAFMAIVDASQAPESSELADTLDAMKNPDVVTVDKIAAEASKPPTSKDDFFNWLTDRKNRRAIPHRMETAGYVALRNQTTKDGLWFVFNKRQTLYVKSNLSIKGQHLAVRKFLEDNKPEEKESK